MEIIFSSYLFKTCRYLQSKYKNQPSDLEMHLKIHRRACMYYTHEAYCEDVESSQYDILPNALSKINNINKRMEHRLAE